MCIRQGVSSPPRVICSTEQLDDNDLISLRDCPATIKHGKFAFTPQTPREKEVFSPKSAVLQSESSPSVSEEGGSWMVNAVTGMATDWLAGKVHVALFCASRLQVMSKSTLPLAVMVEPLVQSHEVMDTKSI